MKNGFSLLEILIVLGIMVLLSSLSIPAYSNFFASSQVDFYASQIKEALDLAHGRSISAYHDIGHGVYFFEDGQSFLAYEGNSYSERNSQYDQEYILADEIDVVLNLTDRDISFIKNSGYSSATGTIAVSKNNQLDYFIQINKYGLIAN